MKIILAMAVVSPWATRVTQYIEVAVRTYSHALIDHLFERFNLGSF